MDTLKQFTSRNGLVVISLQNIFRNGSGPMGTVITASSAGTVVQTITVKAINNTTEGMIRLFIDDGSGNINLLNEIIVPATTATSVEPSFGISVSGGFSLKAGYSLKAATENNESFAVSADCYDWTNCSCPA